VYFFLVWAGCSGGRPGEPGECGRMEPGPSDDPQDWEVDTSVEYQVTASEARFVVPSDALPVETQVSNNNVSIWLGEERLFLAWRTGPIHFATPQTAMHVISSEDGGESWVHEHSIELGSDVREPALGWWDGTLWMSFFQGGTDPFGFEPQGIWRSERCGVGNWTDTLVEDDTTRVPWDLKLRNGRWWRTSYTGEHYGEGILDLHFEVSDDGGESWAIVGEDPVYQGGNSEAAIEFDETGALWAVTRNEDGDETGQGSMVCVATAEDPGIWDCPEVSDPQRYDSPELFRHGDDLYLVARRDVDGAFGEDEGLLPYSTRPKRTALYQLDRTARRVVHLMDLPGVGDTAFPSIVRTSEHTFLLANYTSPLDDPDISWLEAQTSPRGTQLYLLELSFAPAR
jgi:hypothetical protein